MPLGAVATPAPVSAPPSVPADSVPAPSGGDFRHQAMHAQRPKSEREQAAPSGEFREGLMPTDSGPVAPRPGQLRTDHISPDAVKADLKAIRDALAAVAIPFIEIHLSNVHARETFRRQSYFSDRAVGVVAGFGQLSYEMALEAAIDHVSQGTA